MALSDQCCPVQWLDMKQMIGAYNLIWDEAIRCA